MKKYKTLLVVLTALCSLLPALLYSQVDTTWVRRYNGPSGTGGDYASAMAVDGAGNVYVTGYSTDPGASVFSYATIKYNSNGDTLWVRRYKGPGSNSDTPRAIAVDGTGNVYVTGYSPGSGTGNDYATIKYVQTPQGVEEERFTLNAKRNTLAVYPNPAKSYFTIRLPQSADRLQIKIYDVTGKEIRSLKFDVASAPSTLRVTLDGIKNGVYFVKVGNEMIREKLVVTK